MSEQMYYQVMEVITLFLHGKTAEDIDREKVEYLRGKLEELANSQFSENAYISKNIQDEYTVHLNNGILDLNYLIKFNGDRFNLEKI